MLMAARAQSGPSCMTLVLAIWACSASLACVYLASANRPLDRVLGESAAAACAAASEPPPPILSAFDFLPDLTEEEIGKQVKYCFDKSWAVKIFYGGGQGRAMAAPWGLPLFDIKDPAAVIYELNEARKAKPSRSIYLQCFDSTVGHSWGPALTIQVQRDAARQGQHSMRQSLLGKPEQRRQLYEIESVEARTRVNSERYGAGVLAYARMGYWDADYVVKVEDVQVLYRVTPQPGVDPVEMAACIAAGLSFTKATVDWSELLTPIDLLRGKAYRVDPVPNDVTSYFMFVAYPIETFASGGMSDILSRINTQPPKSAKQVRVEDIRLPMALQAGFPGPAVGASGVFAKLGVAGRALVTCTMPPATGFDVTQYANFVMQALAGGADITMDNLGLIWPDRERYTRMLHLVGASLNGNHIAAFANSDLYVSRDQAWSNALGGTHCVNPTGPSAGETLERAANIRQAGLTCMVVNIDTVGFALLPDLVALAKRDRLILGATVNYNKAAGSGGVTELVLLKLLRLAGVDMVFQSVSADPLIALGRTHVLQDSVETTLTEGIYFEQHWMPNFAFAPPLPLLDQQIPYPGSGFFGGFLLKGELTSIWPVGATDPVGLEMGGAVFGHPDGIQAGATAARVAVQALTKARNEGLDVKDGEVGRTILRDAAAQFCGPLKTALDLWNDVTYLYASKETAAFEETAAFVG